MGVLTDRALDICLTDSELCEAIGYLASPGRILRIEAQVPNGKEDKFKAAYPGQEYYHMLPTSDKQSFQLRIMMNTTNNCPDFLDSHITRGGGNTSAGCISRGKFVEKLVGEFGFEFTVGRQDIDKIKKCVQKRYPKYMKDFNRGYDIPLN